jgi:hypothetical protein
MTRGHTCARGTNPKQLPSHLVGEAGEILTPLFSERIARKTRCPSELKQEGAAPGDDFYRRRGRVFRYAARARAGMNPDSRLAIAFGDTALVMISESHASTGRHKINSSTTRAVYDQPLRIKTGLSAK